MTIELRPRQNVKVKDLISMDPCAIAQPIIGLHYFGDVNFIPHGGLFFDTTNWDNYGYAEGIEIEMFGDSNSVCLYDVTVNKLNEAEYLEALRACGYLLEERLDADGKTRQYVYQEGSYPDTGHLRNMPMDIEVTYLYGLRVDRDLITSIPPRKSDGEIAEYTACRVLREHLLLLINDV